MNILNFINELRDSDEYIKHIYMKGSCYKFHILLSKMYKNTIPYISIKKDHIITRYKDRYYDINGEVYDVKDYRTLDIYDIPMVENWSFRNNNLLQLNECPNCDEPLVYNELFIIN
jgi:hypothetical protein